MSFFICITVTFRQKPVTLLQYKQYYKISKLLIFNEYLERKINMDDFSQTNEAYLEDADLTVLTDLLTHFIKALLFDSNNTLYVRFDDKNFPNMIKLDIADSTVIIKNKKK